MEEHAKTYSQSYKYDLKADKKRAFGVKILTKWHLKRCCVSF